MDEYYKIKNEFKNNPSKLNSALVSLAIFMGAFMLGVFVLAKVLQWLNT